MLMADSLSYISTALSAQTVLAAVDFAVMPTGGRLHFSHGPLVPMCTRCVFLFRHLDRAKADAIMRFPSSY